MPTPPPPPSEDPPRHDAYAAFRYPAFRRYMIGSQLMTLGTSAQALAIGWEMYERTNDPLALGLVGLVQAIPMLLLTLPAGYLADIFDRRKLMIVSMLGTSLTSLGLAASSYYGGSNVLMYGLLLLDSSFIRLGWPARAALLPLLVPRSAFENAVKWRSSLGQTSALVGPAIGGFVLAWSIPATYVMSALSTFAFMAMLMTIRISAQPTGSPAGMFEQIGEGLRFVWSQKLLLGATSLDLFGVLLGGAVYLLPIFARDILDTEAVGLSPEQAMGWLRSAPVAGAMLMALWLAHRPPLRRAGRAMLWAFAGFGAATIGFGLSTSFFLSLAMLFLTGVFDTFSVVVRQTLLQLVTPDHMRGRVSAVSAVFISSSNELGGFESGLVARLFGPVFSVVSGGVGTIVVVAVWSRLFPKLRDFGRLDEAKAD
ncbi:MAG: MFS transporter [Planctomycetota bacterium]